MRQNVYATIPVGIEGYIQTTDKHDKTTHVVKKTLINDLINVSYASTYILRSGLFESYI